MYAKHIVLGVCACCLLAATPGQQAELAKLLTIEDVEAVAEIGGIKLVPRNPQIGAGGDLNFALADGTMLLVAQIQDAPLYDEWKGQEGFFHASVADVGDEAFEGPSFGAHRYVLIFRKGGTAVSLSSFFNMKAGGAPYLSQAQLRAIAAKIVSRL